MTVEVEVPFNNTPGPNVRRKHRQQTGYSKMIVGTVVWCWVKGYPWWPAVIRDPSRVYTSLNETDRNSLPALSSDSRLVEFFNDNNKVYVAPLDKLRLYTNDMSLLSQAGPEYRTPIARACDEADKYRQALGQLNVEGSNAGMMISATTAASVSIDGTLDLPLTLDYRRERMRSRVTTKRPLPSHSASSTPRGVQARSTQPSPSRARHVQVSPKRNSRTTLAKNSPKPSNGVSNKKNEVGADPLAPNPAGHPPWTTPLSVEPDSPPNVRSPRPQKPSDNSEIPMKLRVRGQFAAADRARSPIARKKSRANIDEQPVPGQNEANAAEADRRSERSRAINSQLQKDTKPAISTERVQDNHEKRCDDYALESVAVGPNGRRNEDEDDVDHVQGMDVEDNSLESLAQNGRQRTSESIGLNEDDDDDLDLENKFADDMDFVKKGTATMMKWVSRAKNIVERVPISLAKLDNLKQQQSDLTKSIDKLRVTEDRLKASVKAQGNLLELLQQQINSTKQELNEYESKVDSSKQEAEKLEKTVANYRSEVTRLKRSLTQMRKESGFKLGRTRENTRRSTAGGSSSTGHGSTGGREDTGKE